ncbi:MAG: sigma-54-dependent Fis family transcriptional regulator [Desulfobacteraceae bacterium]|nr:sigma-54-dependent Fis family transcriptional regulator [Desulfobacteraceae bacterium]
MNNHIIVVDDDRDYLLILGKKLSNLGYDRVCLEDNPDHAVSLINSGQEFDLALIDMTMPEMDGMELLGLIKNTSPRTECIMVTALDQASTAVDCLKKGAYDYLVKPVAADVLDLSVGRALERKRLLDILELEKGGGVPELSDEKAFAPIITQSPVLIRVLKEAELHAASDMPVLITGESGTGKELLARAIHAASPRATYAFTPINMASVNPGLFEAEFFGHTRGAFTGASSERVGYLQHTHKGTLFLDEIGDLPLELQGKLLRVLQNGEFTRLGSSRSQTVDLRFIAATNENLDRMILKRAFRKDLYYRIRGGWLHLPALRERSEDIPLLSHKFLSKYFDDPGVPGIEQEALHLLLKYEYPGNVRELKSIIQSAVNLARGHAVSAMHLPRHILQQGSRSTGSERPDINTAISPLAEIEKSHILKTYRRLQRNKSRTAKALGIGLNTLRRKLEQYGTR